MNIVQFVEHKPIMIEIRLRCGEVYSFNMIKSITDLNNGTIEIEGNFKPRGRHHSVVLWKQAISNLDEIEKIYDIKESPYFCLNCKKTHYSGEIYYDHKEYYGKKEDLIPDNRIISYDKTKLRNIAKQQLKRLKKKIKLNPRRSDLYRKEINKLILYEGANNEKLF